MVGSTHLRNLPKPLKVGLGLFEGGLFLIRLGSEAANADMPDLSNIQQIKTFHLTSEQNMEGKTSFKEEENFLAIF